MQNLKIATAFLCAVLLSITQISAQFDFQKGYIITLNGDTLNGFVKDQTFDQLSRQVVFKKSRKANSDTYLPAELKAYGFNDGDVFESFEIEYTSATRRGKTKEVSLVRFLSKVVDGALVLYELTDKERPLFIKKGDGPLMLLCLREALVTTVYDENGAPKTPESGRKYYDNNGNRLIERDGAFYRLEDEYKTLLKEQVADCEKITVSKKLPLKRRNIENLVNRYNMYCAPEAYQKFMNSKKQSPLGRFTMYSSVPFKYAKEFGGVGGGAMIEIGGQYFSASFGVEYVIGKKDAEKDFNYKLFSATLRTNYRPFGYKKLSPYVFTGFSMNATSRKVDIIAFRKKSFVDIELGLGADYYLSDRFYIKGEVAYPHFPNARLGIGMLIK